MIALLFVCFSLVATNAALFDLMPLATIPHSHLNLRLLMKKCETTLIVLPYWLHHMILKHLIES